MLYSFLCSLARSKYLFFLLLSLIFTLWSVGTAKSTVQQVLFLINFFCFLLIITSFCLLGGIRGSVCRSKRILCISFTRTDSGLHLYHLSVWSNFNFLHYSQWTTFPTQSCLVFYSFCTRLLHSFTRFMVSSLWPLTFFCYSVVYYRFSI